MRRPLAFMCLVYILAAGVFVWLRPPDLNCYEYAEGLECRIIGEIYKIESEQYFGNEQSVIYLKQISHFEVIQENQSEKSPSLTEKNNPPGVVCYLSGDATEIKLGSKVLVDGIFENFSKATNPGEFDARTYNRILGVCGKVKKASICNTGEGYDIPATLAYTVRLKLEERLKSIYPNKEAGILMTMLLGDKSELDREIKGLYQNGGIIHILSVSGLHISVLGMGVYKVLRKIGVPMRVASFLSVIWMWFYGTVIGMGVSALRAIVMFSVRMMAALCGRTYDLLTALAVAAAILVGSEPMYFYHSGFWLSFVCVLAISLLYPLLKIEEKEEYARWKKMLVQLCNSFMVSVSIIVFTLPVMLWFYYEVSLWGLVWNLIVVPLASVVMGLGITTLCLPVGTEIIIKANCVVLGVFEYLCRITEMSGVGNFIAGKPDVWQVVIFAVGMEVLIVIGKKIRYAGRIITLVILIFILVLRAPQEFRITFMDVGQGDGICIQNDNGTVYLVDGGSSSKSQVGTYQIIPFLKHEGIRRVDGVFLTHGDKDHISGIEELLEMQKGGIRIRKVILPDLAQDHLEQEFGRIIELCMENDTDIYVMSQGKSIHDKELMLTCMHPFDGDSGDSNESSLVLYLTYKNFSALLTGDVELHGEERLNGTLVKQSINNITLLKVAHHGSSGSTGEIFLKQTSPRVAIISCGENNSYGHPHKETLKRLEDAGAVVLTTPECGAIILEIDGAISFRTMKNN